MNIGIKIRVRGIVQGVGFRPFVVRLASELGVYGTVANDTEGVLIEAEADEETIREFSQRLITEQPPLAHITSVESSRLKPKGLSRFSIAKSGETGGRSAFYSSDAAMCGDCRLELFDADNRRYLYPFITCINCGPRFSIVRDIPYDRVNTTMDAFKMCGSCRQEYDSQTGRRFHSQPNACPECGPVMKLTDSKGNILNCPQNETAIEAVKLLKLGKILAVKGIGGYHLAADGRNGQAVAELRRRKNRPWKPFALMASSVDSAAKFCRITPAESALLESKESPIVLLKKNSDLISNNVAPGVSFLGVMLPYSPFHHMLFNVDPEMILVMTSGNTSEEPIAFRDSDAFKRLSLIADYFISNDREITGQSDDSVMFVTNEQPFFARRSRGFVPAPFESLHSNGDILAVGGDMKNAFALTKGADVILSQYLGDMSDPLTHDVFRDTLKKYTEIFSIKPAVVASDLHPAYLSAEFADELAGTDAARIRVQHHHAHIAALLEEHADDGPIVGVAFDGTGYGTDGKLWGSEIMTATRGSFKRLAHFSYFKLPGGESSIHDTWKIGLSLLWQKFGKNIPDIFADYPADAVIEMLDKNINCPETCSIGRLFDGIAAILGISREVSAEAEAATLLEEAALRGRTVMNDYIIPHHIVGNEIIISSEELVLLMADSIIAGFSSDDLALIFHRAIIATTVSLAFDICENEGINKVGLSGGAFQNRILLGGITNSLASRGIIVLNHCKAPCNDGCIALGQIAVARELMNNMQNAN